MRDQRRMRPTGIDAPPTITPRTVRSQVRFMEATFRIQQNLLRKISEVRCKRRCKVLTQPTPKHTTRYHNVRF